ncbi:MAG: 30S ribosomal protein S1 [Anaerolineaceae bacterium]
MGKKNDDMNDDDDEMMPQSDEGWWSSVLADEEASPIMGKEQNIRLTNQPLLSLVDWNLVQSLYEQDEVVELPVQGFNRGGLLVQDNGVQGFVPLSHLVEMPVGISDEERRTILASYMGRTLRLKVIECEPTLERVVLSERAALAGEGKRKLLFMTLKPGEIVKGTVTNVTEFGVFIDLGGVEGLIHVSELSWGRVQNPSEVLKINQIISAQVLQVSEENSRVALSYKRLQPNPWEELASSYKMNDVVPATVTSIMKFGVFARLKEGIEGLIHISSIDPAIDQASLAARFFPGQNLTVKILHIDIDRRRLGLGLVSTE